MAVPMALALRTLCAWDDPGSPMTIDNVCVRVMVADTSEPLPVGPLKRTKVQLGLRLPVKTTRNWTWCEIDSIGASRPGFG